MSNTNRRCKECPYNKPKKAGGFGRICNGLTMAKYGRCPEWRISEIIRLTDKAYNHNKDYHEIV